MNIFHAFLPFQHHLLHVTMLILLPNCAVHHRRHAMRQTEVQNDLREECVTLQSHIHDVTLHSTIIPERGCVHCSGQLGLAISKNMDRSQLYTMRPV